MQARDIRKIILEQSHRAHVGHIGSSLSIADIIAVLYRDVLRISEPSDHERDRFILSKGHAALALYAALFLKGWMSESDLDSFCGDGTLLGVHPERGEDIRRPRGDTHRRRHQTRKGREGLLRRAG